MPFALHLYSFLPLSSIPIHLYSTPILALTASGASLWLLAYEHFLSNSGYPTASIFDTE